MEAGRDQYLLAGELSEILQINDTEIARLARRGILPRIPDPNKDRSYLYLVVSCAKAYIGHLKNAAQRDRDRRQQRRKQKKQRARLLTSECDTRVGRPLDAREVEARERELAIAIRPRLALIPLRLADRLGKNGDRLAIEAAAEAEINEALLALNEVCTC